MNQYGPRASGPQNIRIKSKYKLARCPRSSQLVIIFFSIFFLSSCSKSIYILKASIKESQILLAREPINLVIIDPKTPEAEREKLQLVLDARQYAIKIGLTPKRAFTKYSKVDGDVLVWVFMAAKADSFELEQWWFPIVGYVPYKGYFDKEDAIKVAKEYKARGFEVAVRGSEAFSTLGWFDDPVLSTTLKNEALRIANTVLHESTHSTVWIPNSVDFNESLANFVGHRSAIDFFDQNPKLKNQAISEYQREIEVGQALVKLYENLEKLYKSSLTHSEKMAERIKIFENDLKSIKQKYPELKILKEINNAEIMQLKVYLTGLDLFEKLFIKSGQDWAVFIEKIKEIKHETENTQTNPWEILANKVISKLAI